MNGPLSPEELARVNAYYGGAGISSPADAPPPVGPPPPPGPQVDTGPMYDYSSSPPAPEPPPPGPKPFSWNAPGYEDSVPHPFGGTSPPPTNAPPAPSGPAPSFARSGPQSDLEPSAPAAPTDASKAAAAALAHYGGAGKKSAPSGGGGGFSSGPRKPSDYEKGVAGLRGSYDEEKGAIQRGATAEEDRSALIAQGAQEAAQRKAEDAAIQQMEAANAAKHFDDYSAETQRQIDDVRSQKIDPNRLYADAGSAFLAAIGGALGGMYQGLNHLSSNPFLDQMNKNIDRDIAVQEKNLQTKKEGIGERRNMLSEMRATYKDDALAKLQAKNLYYEAAKESLAADASTYDSPIIQSRADQAITALSREQSKLDINEAIKKAAAAQAAGAAAEHRRQIDFDNALKLHGARVEDRKLDIEAGKAADAPGGSAERFVATGKDAAGNPIGYLGRNAKEAEERETATIAAQKLLKQIDRVQQIRNEQGGLGRAFSEGAHGVYDTKAANELAVLESDMTTTMAQSAHLGALSDSDRQLLTAKIRNLNSVGGGADERLDELRRIAQSGLQAERESAAGARATKVVGADGREHVIVNGAQNAPTNDRTTPRERVGP